MVKPTKDNSNTEKRRGGTTSSARGNTKNTKAIQPLRENSKLAAVIILLRRKGGATIEQMVKATGWQSHSVRGAMSGAIKRKRGLEISSSKTGDVRSYRITAKKIDLSRIYGSCGAEFVTRLLGLLSTSWRFGACIR